MKVVCWTFVMALLGLCNGLWNDGGDDESEEWQPASLRDTEFLQDQQHIRHHYEDLNFVFEEGDVQAEEMEFHFFKAHDSNSDNKLDGLELLDALKHGAQRHLDRAVAKHLTPDEQKARVEKVYERLSNKVDQILEEDDTNNDGYISYFEYVSARRTSQTLHEAEATDQGGTT